MDAEDVEHIELDDNESSPLLHDSHHRTGQMESTIAISEKLPSRKVTKSHEKGIKMLNQKFYDVRAQHSQLSRKLYEAETMLPPTVKRAYDSIRKNPKWYMRKELIVDCVGRDGCCSRGFGCCALRASHSYKKSIDHCTVKCICCIRNQGFRPSSEEKKEVLKGMTMLFRCDVATF